MARYNDYYALMHYEIGALGVGKSELEAISSYAQHIIDEGSECQNLDHHIDAIYAEMDREDMGAQLEVVECTKEMYEDFKARGNCGSYDMNEVGLWTVVETD